MDVRVKAAVAGGVEGVNKTALARELGISRDTLYRYLKRFEADGLEGLESRSRRPHRSPGQVGVGMEDLIVRTRKELLDQGLDAGHWSIHDWLVASGAPEVVHPSTIWRVLKRRGVIVAEPKKRPKVTYHRFEAGRPNELWQIDATHALLADGSSVEVINAVDDHSRVCVCAVAVTTTTASAVWQALSDAITTWGAPQRILSDNGQAFIAESVTENLTALGINRSRSRPYHPQTNGKVERFHQTQRRWLNALEAPANLTELQHQLDSHAEHYNHRRDHSAIGRQPPIRRFNASNPAVPIGVDITDAAVTRAITVDSRGTANLSRRYAIGLGIAHAGTTVTITTQGLHAAVFTNNTLIRSLTLDPTRRYQPTGHKPGPTTHP